MEILIIFIVFIAIAIAVGSKEAKRKKNNERVHQFRRQQAYEHFEKERKEAEDKEDGIILDAQEALKRETNEERRGFIQHIINTADLRRERRNICAYLHNDRNKERYPDEYEKKSRQLEQNFMALKDINHKFSSNYPQDVMKAYKKFSAAFNVRLSEIWVTEEEYETLRTKVIKLEDGFLSDEGLGQPFLGYNNPEFQIGDVTYYFFPMYVVACKNDASIFKLVTIEDVSVTYEYQEFTERRHLVSSIETSRYIYTGEYTNQDQASIYSKEIIGYRTYGKLTIHPFEATLYASNLPKGVRLFKAINEYIDFVKSKKGLISEKTIEEVPKQEGNEIAEQIVSDSEPGSYYNYDEMIEVTYSVFGYDRLGETTFDMEVKGKEYEWLQNAEGDEGELTSDYISENRSTLHKRILKAIRNNMKDEGSDPDDGMVEYVSSAVHHKEFFEDASYDYASDFAEDDDIEYTVTL